MNINEGPGSKKPWSTYHGKMLSDYDSSGVFNRYSDFIRIPLFIIIEHPLSFTMI